MIAGNAEHFVAALAHALEEFACLAKLLGARTLGEVAADDDEVGLQLINLRVDGRDELLIVRSEMEVG
jgi:hypothetical protein